ALESGEDIPPIVASNIIYPTDDNGNIIESLQHLHDAMDAYDVQDYTVIEKSGIRIGVIGLLGEEAAGDAPMSGVEFDHIVDAAQATIDRMKEEEDVRSEEHTSELQSRFDLVCRLLLEKKKQN